MYIEMKKRHTVESKKTPWVCLKQVLGRVCWPHAARALTYYTRNFVRMRIFTVAIVVPLIDRFIPVWERVWICSYNGVCIYIIFALA